MDQLIATEYNLFSIIVNNLVGCEDAIYQSMFVSRKWYELVISLIKDIARTRVGILYTSGTLLLSVKCSLCGCIHSIDIQNVCTFWSIDRSTCYKCSKILQPRYGIYDIISTRCIRHGENARGIRCVGPYGYYLYISRPNAVNKKYKYYFNIINNFVNFTYITRVLI